MLCHVHTGLAAEATSARSAGDSTRPRRRAVCWQSRAAGIQPLPEAAPWPITPKGWLRHMLELERDGMTGRLKEVSPWLRFEASGLGPPGWPGRARPGRNCPYWLKGYGDLGYCSGTTPSIAEARRWIEAVMASQRKRRRLLRPAGAPDQLEWASPTCGRTWSCLNMLQSTTNSRATRG